MRKQEAVGLQGITEGEFGFACRRSADSRARRRFSEDEQWRRLVRVVEIRVRGSGLN